MQTRKYILFSFLTLSFLGFVDATYLTIQHYSKGIIPCNIGQCEKVLTSAYATAGNVPVSLLGAIYYLALSLLVIVYLDSKYRNALYVAKKLTWLGFLTSLALVYIQLFVLHALCIYCMASATISTLLFILSFQIKTPQEKTLQ